MFGSKKKEEIKEKLMSVLEEKESEVLTNLISKAYEYLVKVVERTNQCST
ncbi:MAG: hypothetical protein ACUVUG_09705 [Candidatus Aminicenantia bacterium]